jgi:hypothetical protein
MLSVSVTDHCTDAFEHSVGLTDATKFSALDRQLDYQCTDRFKKQGIGLTDLLKVFATCAIHLS